MTSATEAMKILKAAQNHIVLGSSRVVWIGIQRWQIDADSTTSIPNGAMSIEININYGYNYRYDEYMDKWKQLNPADYFDADGDRNTLNTYSAFMIDALYALAMTYELSYMGTGDLTDAAAHAYEYSTLLKDVSFLGVSGPVDFSSSGDRVATYYGIYNYRSSSNTWPVIGKTTQEMTYMNESAIRWPDGSTGISSTYSYTLPSYCDAGEEPVSSSDGSYVCTPCPVGTYKAYEGSTACSECPLGALCNDIGITVPCIEAGYWRSEPASADELGDFGKYKIYSCDVVDNCLGGCQLNNTCDRHVLQSSPVCGVCDDKYYLQNGRCLSCASAMMDSKRVGRLVYSLSTVCMFVVLVVLMVGNIRLHNGSNPASPNISIDKDEHSASLYATESSSFKRFNSRSASIMFSPTLNLFREERHKRAVKKMFRGTAMSAKITLSFLQVMTGSLFVMNIKWSGSIDWLRNTLNFNPFRTLEATLRCSPSGNTPFLMKTIAVCVTPMYFLALLACAATVTWHMHVAYRKYCGKEVKAHAWEAIRNLSIKIFLWFCLIIYPALSSM